MSDIFELSEMTQVAGEPDRDFARKILNVIQRAGQRHVYARVKMGELIHKERGGKQNLFTHGCDDKVYRVVTTEYSSGVSARKKNTVF